MSKFFVFHVRIGIVCSDPVHEKERAKTSTMHQQRLNLLKHKEAKAFNDVISIKSSFEKEQY